MYGPLGDFEAVVFLFFESSRVERTCSARVDGYVSGIHHHNSPKEKSKERKKERKKEEKSNSNPWIQNNDVMKKERKGYHPPLPLSSTPSFI